MGGNAQIAVEECAKLCPSCDCIASQAEFQNEEPPHNVTLDPFYLDLYEVSNAQYQECDNAGICESPTTAGQNNYLNPEYADFPVVNVTWIDTNAYCGWRKARLPTEV